ncbi:sirohydrochlorin chelatase [Streptomyces sp. NPDC087420]|uniref:sirohydrochlorin chelatase n=1 Tax=Streptomyces sp. NPDC087420 TaxID=3365785 RepID=UPI0038378E8C
MSTPTGPAPGLPVRMPRPRQSGRHRRPEPVAAPEGAPALVLAVPGAPSDAARGLAEEVISIARSELPGLDAAIGFLDGSEDADETTEQPTLQAVLTRLAARRIERYELAKAAGREVTEPEGPAAVVVPLLTGPENDLLDRIRRAVVDSGTEARTTDVLGPHPLLAEGLHVRLSEAGLARADRARLFTVATAADGIILVTVGGEEAVRTAGITGMLLAARLAVPVMAAALDVEGSVAAVAEELRGSGATQLALAPYLVGPELPGGLLDAALKEADSAAAEPLGAYPAIGKLVLSKYTAELGIAEPAQGAPTH